MSVLIFKVWTSQLKRTIQTAKEINATSQEQWKALDELDAVSYFHFFQEDYTVIKPVSLLTSALFSPTLNKCLYKYIYVCFCLFCYTVKTDI